MRTVASCHALLGLWLSVVAVRVAKSRSRANEREIGTHPTYLLLEGLHMCITRSSHGNDRHILQYLTTSHNTLRSYPQLVSFNSCQSRLDIASHLPSHWMSLVHSLFSKVDACGGAPMARLGWEATCEALLREWKSVQRC